MDTGADQRDGANEHEIKATCTFLSYWLPVRNRYGIWERAVRSPRSLLLVGGTASRCALVRDHRSLLIEFAEGVPDDEPYP